MNRMLRFIVTLFVATLVAAPVAAQELTGTLKKIKDTGTIVIGHRESSVPFSYLDDNQKPVGYSLDICMRIVDAIKAKLELSELEVNFIPVTSQTRIPLMANGTIDLECGSTTNTVERQKQVAFAYTTFVTGTKLLVKKDSGVESIDDLKGKPVVVTQGTTNERVVKQLNDEKQLGIRFLHAKDHAESFLTVDTDRAAAFPMDDVLLYGLVAKSKDPENWAVVGELLSYDPYAIMFRKDDPEIAQVVNDTIAALFESGEIVEIYERWFDSEELKVPMSDNLKAAIENPNSEGAK